MFIPASLSLYTIFLWLSQTYASLQRQTIVQCYNVHRNKSSKTTPLQAGNGNFAFGVGVTGFRPLLFPLAY